MHVTFFNINTIYFSCVYFDPRLFVPNSSNTVDCLLKRCLLVNVGRSGLTPGRLPRRINSFFSFSLDIGSAGDITGGGKGISGGGGVSGSKI